MTVGIVLMKGLPGQYEHTYKFLMEMKRRKTLKKEKKSKSEKFFLVWVGLI
jgi:hypothetical protein